MTARFFQGAGVSPAATVGLAIINDLFFDYQRGFKTGLWVLAVDIGLSVGPLVGGFIGLVNESWTQWLTAILFGLILILELLFLPETLYPREYVLQLEGNRDAGSRAPALSTELSDLVMVDAADNSLRRTTTLPFLNIKPVPGIKHPPIWETVWRFIQTWRLSAVSVTLATFAFGW